MKKILIILIFSLLPCLVACSSEEGKALADYHNSYVETVNEKASQLEVELEKSLNAETPEKELELQKENVLPIMHEIKDYLKSLEPESEVVKEIHNMRLAQLDAWKETFDLRYQALEKTIEDAEEGVVNKLMQKSEEKWNETQNKAQLADEKMAELAAEYNVKLREE